MSSRSGSVFLAAVVATACASAIPLDVASAGRLRSASSIAVAWVASGEPRVECPSDEGVKTWEFPGSRLEPPAGPAGPVRLVSFATPAAWPALRAPGGTWATIVGEWTESLRVPPVDPALATARAFLRYERARPGGLAWGAAPVQARDVGSPVSGSKADLVLLVEARRFSLLGCYFRFSPWFDARATLLDTSTDRVLWRDACDDDVGPGAGPEAWPSDLTADGGALYARTIEARAEACAGHLSRALHREGSLPSL